jgi:DamX protein
MRVQRGAARRAGFAFNLPRKHLLALAVVGLGVLAAWLMQGYPDDAAPMPVTTQLPLDPIERPVVDAPASESAAAGAPAIEFEGGNKPVPLPLVGEAQPVIREPLARAAGLSGVEEADVADVAGSSAVGVLVDEREAPTIAPVAPAPPAVPVAPEPAAVAAVAPPAPVVTPASKPVVTAPAKAVTVDDWYAAQAGSRYTLQILGARAEDSAQAFVREYGTQYHYFKKQHQGQPLYVVTYGSFGTREAAQVALKSLPDKVQAGKPWPRTFASIRHEMTQAR